MADFPLRFSEDDELCVCFHVSRRQIAKFLRLSRPRLASQCSECYGAGTGCGWCIPFIEKLFESHAAGLDAPVLDLTPEEYRARRREYLRRNPEARPPADTTPPPPPEPETAWTDRLLTDDMPPESPFSLPD